MNKVMIANFFYKRHWMSDEKIARTRAALIARTNQLMQWDAEGNSYLLDENGEWQPWENE